MGNDTANTCTSKSIACDKKGEGGETEIKLCEVGKPLIESPRVTLFSCKTYNVTIGWSVEGALALVIAAGKSADEGNAEAARVKGIFGAIPFADINTSILNGGTFKGEWKLSDFTVTSKSGLTYSVGQFDVYKGTVSWPTFQGAPTQPLSLEVSVAAATIDLKAKKATVGSIKGEATATLASAGIDQGSGFSLKGELTLKCNIVGAFDGMALAIEVAEDAGAEAAYDALVAIASDPLVIGVIGGGCLFMYAAYIVAEQIGAQDAINAANQFASDYSIGFKSGISDGKFEFNGVAQTYQQGVNDGAAARLLSLGKAQNDPTFSNYSDADRQNAINQYVNAAGQQVQNQAVAKAKHDIFMKYGAEGHSADLVGQVFKGLFPNFWNPLPGAPSIKDNMIADSIPRDCYDLMSQVDPTNFPRRDTT